MVNRNPLCGRDDNPRVWLEGGETALNLLIESLPEDHYHLVEKVRAELKSLAGDDGAVIDQSEGRRAG